jgi:hypothetical protein
MMFRQRRKTDRRSDETVMDSDTFTESSLKDYFRFVFYCILLAVPLYAITVSILKHDWLMVIIDALFVPVGFVHGILLLFGFV